MISRWKPFFFFIFNADLMGNLMTIQPSLHTRAYRCYSPAARPPRDGPCSYRTFRKIPSHRRGHWLGNMRTYFCCKKDFFENVKICNIYTYLKYNFWFKKAWSKTLNISKYVTFFSHKISVLQFRPSLAVDAYSTNIGWRHHSSGHYYLKLSVQLKISTLFILFMTKNVTWKLLTQILTRSESNSRTRD